LVLGGNFPVLSISIFFAVVGAQHDQSRAAVLSIVLLVFTLGAFYAQRRWLGRRSYATVTGKGDSGLHPPLPALVRRLAYATALPWAVFTLVIYSMILFGGFVETWGPDHRFSLPHSAAASPRPAPPLRGRIRRRRDRLRSALEGSGLELLLDDPRDRGRLGALDRGRRTPHCLPAGASAFPRQGGVRVRHDAQLRDSRDRDRDQLHPGLQHAADRADRYGDHPGHLLRLPQHAGGRPRRHRVDDPDRSKPG